MSQRELRKVPLEVIVASHGAISSHDQELLIFGPSKALNGAFIPADAPDGLSGAAVDIDAGLGDLGGLKGYQLGLIAIQCYNPVRIFSANQ